MCWWLLTQKCPSTLYPEPHPTPPRELHGAHGCHSPTSIIVFAVTTGSFHRCVTASSSPAQLTDAVPPIQVQGASAVAIAQPRAALCKAKPSESRSDHPRSTAVTHTHTPPANSQSACTSISTSVPLAPREAGLMRNCHLTDRQLRLRGGRICEGCAARNWHRQEVVQSGSGRDRSETCTFASKTPSCKRDQDSRAELADVKPVRI